MQRKSLLTRGRPAPLHFFAGKPNLEPKHASAREREHRRPDPAPPEKALQPSFKAILLNPKPVPRYAAANPPPLSPTQSVAPSRLKINLD